MRNLENVAPSSVYRRVYRSTIHKPFSKSRKDLIDDILFMIWKRRNGKVGEPMGTLDDFYYRLADQAISKEYRYLRLIGEW